jgi:hypothetical protein
VSATRGTVTGGNKSGETGTASRLGSRYVTARANTWQTFATVTTWHDGRVTFTVTDDNGMIIEVTVSAEDAPRAVTIYQPKRREAEGN